MHRIGNNGGRCIVKFLLCILLYIHTFIFVLLQNYLLIATLISTSLVFACYIVLMVTTIYSPSTSYFHTNSYKVEKYKNLFEKQVSQEGLQLFLKPWPNLFLHLICDKMKYIYASSDL